MQKSQTKLLEENTSIWWFLKDIFRKVRVDIKRFYIHVYITIKQTTFLGKV